MMQAKKAGNVVKTKESRNPFSNEEYEKTLADFKDLIETFLLIKGTIMKRSQNVGLIKTKYKKRI